MFSLRVIFFLLGLSAFFLGAPPARLDAAEETRKVDFARVETIFVKHCLDCHSADDPEGELVMESFEDLLKGGSSGPALVKGKSDESLMIKMIEGRHEKEGKKIVMPPGKRQKLSPEEISALRQWIDAGAPAPAEGKTAVRALEVPKITPKGSPRKSIHALAFSASPNLLAIGRYGEVELRRGDTRTLLRLISGLRGNVNALLFSADGRHLFSASGEPGLVGEIRQWKTDDGSLVRQWEGHRDTIYALALSGDGKFLASGSYDQKIKLWKTETGEEVRTFSGHHGAVFDLAFRPDGKILASASADRTVKLWEVATGERRDTLSQSLKELYTLAFSTDGKKLYAAGVDNRIRIWEISESATETTNPLLESKFAHEGAVLNLVFSSDGKTLVSSADDRTVKLWEAETLKEKFLLEKQPDWPPALAFLAENKVLSVGRLDGSLAYYDTATGNVSPPPKAELAAIEPRVFQRGVETRVTLSGKNLAGSTAIKSPEKIKTSFEAASATNHLELTGTVTPAEDLKRGVYELSLEHPNGESAKIKIFVDDLPVIQEAATNQVQRLGKLPATYLGRLEPMGDTDELEFEAAMGETVVFEAAGKNLAGKASLILILQDLQGKELKRSAFDAAVDPMLTHHFEKAGVYRLRISDLTMAGSRDHLYFVSIGSFPLVTGTFPLGVTVGRESEVELLGFNLTNATRKVTADKSGDIDVPLGTNQWRTRKSVQVLAQNFPSVLEIEPNQEIAKAQSIQPPVAVDGKMFNSEAEEDLDHYIFESKAGEEWMIETISAQRGAGLDPRLEILHPDGKPVQRLLLQAVRNSSIAFRSIDSNTIDCRVDNWEEMELNQLLYLQGEVVKLFRAPQGPDSGFQFYAIGGKRKTYFDTSPSVHALEEPCYIVEPHPPGTKLVPNGLPAFPLYFANDDEAQRKLGSDARIHFTAPQAGKYLVRVSDARGQAGAQKVYRLVVRPPKPDFKVTLSGGSPTVPRGSGQMFTVNAERLDDFEGEIKVEITDIPPGFIISTPLIIQAGHLEARGTIYVQPDAKVMEGTNLLVPKLMATATIGGKTVSHSAGTFGKIIVGDKPKLFVQLEPLLVPAPEATEIATNRLQDAENFKPYEITIAPGQTVPARIKIQRNGHEELVTFTVDNLPHGVIVDNIGLNGVLIPKEENERQIFFHAARWVPETDRLCFAIEKEAGKQTSRPLLLKVRTKKGPQSASVR